MSAPDPIDVRPPARSRGNRTPAGSRRRLTRVTVSAAAVMALAASVGSAGPAGAVPAKPTGLTPVTTNRYQALPAQDVMVPTRGGQVFVEFIRPNVPAKTKVPVILTYTPYAALGGGADDSLASFYVPKGYARAVAHVVGTGNSGGCWDYGGLAERASAYDLVEWLGTRTWSNGKVGMIGGSYDGTTANEAAAANPPHLATIVPEVAIAHWYGYAYYGGTKYFIMDPAQRQGVIIDEEGFDTPIGFDFGFGAIPAANPDDPMDYAARTVERMCPADKAAHTEQGYSANPDYDQFWKDRDYTLGAANLATRDGQEIPVLVQGGWRDYNVKHSESTMWFDSVPADNPATKADEGVPFKMLVMGQGAHGGVDPEIHFDVLLHAWFDRWLYGYATNVTMQPVLISKTNDGVVHQDASWPPPATAGVPLYLHPGQRMSTSAPAAADGSETYTDSGTTTESDALNLMDHPGNGQVLWYVTPPLQRDVRMAGKPSLDLFASTLGTSTHFTPVLFDLGPPVTTTASLCTFASLVQACTMSRGFLNARYRNGLEQGQDLTPGEPYRARVDFIDNDWVVKAGHRIGVALMSSNSWWAVSDTQRATNTVRHDAGHPSALVLPIVGGATAASAAGM
jgi:X-Pro dipeptidyl-peptidase